MATLDERIVDDEKFFNYLFEYAHPDASNEIKNFIRKEFLLSGEIQIETMLENAIERVGGPEKKSAFGMDFVDGSDAKKSCVRTRAHGKNYDGSVTGVANKVGSLRVMMYERKQNRFYFFVIPNEAYCGMKYVEIPFTLDGEPKRKNRFWNYEVQSFEEMATK